VLLAVRTTERVIQENEKCIAEIREVLGVKGSSSTLASRQRMAKGSQYSIKINQQFKIDSSAQQSDFLSGRRALPQWTRVEHESRRTESASRQ